MSNLHYVFGYGSLIWRPDFAFLTKQKARITGFHRSLCVYSHEHRGTRERPGLVMGLDEGGECVGVVYAIAPENWQETYTYLHQREMMNYVYEEKWVQATLENGESVQALTYVMDRTHAQYAGALSLEAQYEFVRHSKGKSGRNPDYVINTYEALQALGIEDQGLAELVIKLRVSS